MIFIHGENGLAVYRRFFWRLDTMTMLSGRSTSWNSLCVYKIHMVCKESIHARSQLIEFRCLCSRNVAAICGEVYSLN